MAKFNWQPQHIEWIKTHYAHLRITPLLHEFNRAFNANISEAALKNTLHRFNIKCGRKASGPEKGTLLAWTPEQRDFVKTHYRNISRQQMTDLLNNRFGTNKTLTQLSSFLKNNGITSGRTGHFGPERGPTWNTGTKGLVKPNAGSFKKGQTPHNVKPIGYMRIDNQNGYWLVKINEPDPFTPSPTRYKAAHLVEWEKHNGHVPEGHLISFIDGDRLNYHISNLECVSKQEHLVRNHLKLSSHHPQARPVIKTMAKIKVALNQHEART